MFQVIRGICYPDGQGGEVSHEAGDLVDIPAEWSPGFLECGAVVAAVEEPAPPPAPKKIQGRKATSGEG